MKIPKKAISIDFGSKEIKIIEGKYTKDNIQVLRGITIEIPPDVYRNGIILNTGELAKRLRDELSTNKIKTATTHVVISSSEILIRDIIIPKVAHEEIEAVVNYQIEDYLPIRVEDYEVQYLTRGSVFDSRDYN